MQKHARNTSATVHTPASSLSQIIAPVISYCLLLIFIGTAHAQQAPYELITGHEWETPVTPPPPGEWIKNMPGQRVPRDMPAYTLRAFYVIPSNRTAMRDAVPRMRTWILTMQAFYREQMERNGFGPKTFSFETESDGVTPKIHVVNAPQTDAYFRENPWGRVHVAAQNAGLPVWAPRQVWLGIFEGHIMNPDGSISGIFNGGSTLGSGDDGGLGLMNSNVLACATMDLLTSSALYDGKILPDLGPYPMRLGVTGASFEGETFGAYASTWFGAVVHEMGHAFGLMHDMRNDLNAYGNLMGHGFRGFRQWMFPEADYGTETRLSYGNAMLLNLSRYFNAPAGYTDNTKPVLSAVGQRNVSLVNGCLPVNFTAQDAGGLALAQLILNGNVAEQMPLSGTSVAETFYTPHFVPGANQAVIWVFDQAGNKQTGEFTVTTTASHGNRAPRPFMFIDGKSVREVGESVRYDTGYTSDPDDVWYEVEFEYDLDGDGVWEVAKSTSRSAVATFTTAGNYLARTRVTDPAGNQVISEPIALKVVAPDSAVSDWNLY